jgi:hypothetical protein
MSFFTDVIVASPEDVTAVAKAHNPTEHWPGLALKSINELDFANLYALLLGETDVVTVVALSNEFGTVQISKRKITSVQRFPARFVELLVATPSERFETLAAQWAACEEFHGLWEAVDLHNVISTLQELAFRAQDEGKELLLIIAGV